MKKNNTKRALLLSVLSLLMCCTMLVGSTFAWFTDSVVSKNNIITSGNLDVVLEYSHDGSTWTPVTEQTAIFNENAKYEPGYTEVVFLRISNAGSLALKANLNVTVYNELKSVNVNGEEFALSDYLEIGYYGQSEYNGVDNWGALLPFMFATREAALNQVTLTKLSAFDGFAVKDQPILVGENTAHLVALVLTMPTTVGNEANHKTGYVAPVVELGVTLTATQYTEEADSFDNQYDKDATYDEVPGTDLPRGIVEILDPETVNGGKEVNLYNIESLSQTGETVTMDAAYKFVAPHTEEEAKLTEYADWNTDYVVSFNKDVKAGSAGLGGFYNNWGLTEWIAFTAPMDIEAGVEIPLLEALMGQSIPYWAICRDVKEFECGAFNLDPANAGTIMNVQLRLTNPEDATDYVVCAEFNYVLQ